MQFKFFCNETILPRIILVGCLAFVIFLVNPPVLHNGYKVFTYLLLPLALIELLWHRKLLLKKEKIILLKKFVTPFSPWVLALIVLLLVHQQSGFSGYFLGIAGISLFFLTLTQIQVQRSWVLYSVAISVIVLSVAVIFRVFIGGEASEYFGINRNWLMGGFTLIFTLCLVTLLDREKLPIPKQIALWLACVLGFICLAVSQVRTSLVGILALLPIILFYGKKQKRCFLLTLFVCCFVLALTYFYLSGRLSVAVQDITQYSHGDSNTSLGIRLELWALSLNSFLEHPIQGWGPKALRVLVETTNLGGSIPSSVSLGTHFHSDFFNIMAIGGMVGLIGWLTTIILLIKNSLKDKYRLALIFAILLIGLSDCYWTNCRAVFYLFLVLWLLLYISDKNKSLIEAN